jgi:hypothetical protein
MTRSEYQELVEFLGEKFSTMDRRFDAVDRRLDAVDKRFDGVEGRLTRGEVLAEENRDQIRVLAEGLGSLRAETVDGFAALRSEMAEGFRMHGNIIKDLGQRVDGLEVRRA